jgi:hypothetical protein
MDEYRPVPFQEIMDGMSEDDRRRIEEGAKIIMAEEAFWNSLPEVERNKRLETPKISYDEGTDTLWLQNGRPMARSYEIVGNRVTAFFEAEIWYPSAAKIQGAFDLLGRFFCPEHATGSDTLVRKSSVEGEIERSLKLENLEVRHENLSDYLWIGNGEQGWDGTEFAYELSVSFDEDRKIPVGVLLNPAAELLTPVLAKAAASKAARLL